MREASRRTVGVLAATALGLLARLWNLGGRPAHADEGRFGVRALDVAETGRYAYDPELHGPLLTHADRLAFELFGASDPALRLPVALAGGLLPLAALLYRTRLRDAEVVALAALLAANPLLLYYSRFARNDVLLAAFALTALGFFVRAADTGRHAHLYAAAVALACAAATKGFVLLYAACWVGGAALLLDYRLFTAVSRGVEGPTAASRAVGDWRETAAEWATPAGRAVALFLLVVVFLYAPRPALWQALTDPARIPSVVEAGSYGVWEQFYARWIRVPFSTRHHFTEYFLAYVETLAHGAAVVVGFAAVGFLADRYTEARDVVALASYWGGAGLLLYPVLSVVPGAWTAVHVAAPLAVPAAVGLAAVYRYGRRGHDGGDRVVAGAVALVLLAAAAGVGATAYAGVYADSGASALASPEQPVDDPGPAVAALARETDGEAPDVLFFGPNVDRPSERQPMEWYVRASGAAAESVLYGNRLPSDLPPAVVTTPDDAEALGDRVAAYEEFGPYRLRAPGADRPLNVTVFVDTDNA